MEGWGWIAIIEFHCHFSTVVQWRKSCLTFVQSLITVLVLVDFDGLCLLSTVWSKLNSDQWIPFSRSSCHEWLIAVVFCVHPSRPFGLVGGGFTVKSYKLSMYVVDCRPVSVIFHAQQACFCHHPHLTFLFLHLICIVLWCVHDVNQNTQGVKIRTFTWTGQKQCAQFQQALPLNWQSDKWTDKYMGGWDLSGYSLISGFR